MDCSLPGSSFHGIFQARILEWAAMLAFTDLLSPGIEPVSPALANEFFTTSTTWGAQEITTGAILQMRKLWHREAKPFA